MQRLQDFLLLLALQMMTAFSAIAQIEQELTLVSDRPGFSDCPVTVPKGYFQIESGFTYEQETANPDQKIQRATFNSSLLKYGVTKNLEIRLSKSYASSRVVTGNQALTPGWQNNWGATVLGTKMHVTTESGLRPQTAILTEIGIHSLENGFLFGSNFYRIQLLAGYTLHPRWSLTLNLGTDRSYNLPYSRLRFTINNNYAITEKLFIFAEIYGYRSQNIPLNYFNGGLIYQLSAALQFDISAGMDMVDHYNDILAYNQSFVALGVVYLFSIMK